PNVSSTPPSGGRARERVTISHSLLPPLPFPLLRQAQDRSPARGEGMIELLPPTIFPLSRKGRGDDRASPPQQFSPLPRGERGFRGARAGRRQAVGRAAACP